MKVFCTGYFLEVISDLEKKNNYSGIFKDVCTYFSDKNIDELHITKDILRNSPGIHSINKYRIPNSTIGIGKRGSYRCISMCNVKSDKIFVDFIYPKTGSEGSENITKEGIKSIAINITNSIQSGNIYEIDLQNEQIIDLKGNRIK
jgi:hypothetical protein